MGRRPRPKPKHLAAKLLAIRHKLEVSQSQIAKLLKLDKGARVSEYETGVREPNLLVLLRYSMLARIPMAVLVNDKVELKFTKNWKPATKHELRD